MYLDSGAIGWGCSLIENFHFRTILYYTTTKDSDNVPIQLRFLKSSSINLKN